jgi:hypothetical protein
LDPVLKQLKVVADTVKEAIPQLSLLPPATAVAFIEALPVPSKKMVTLEQDAVGRIVSTVATLKVQLAELPDASVAVIVIVCVVTPEIVEPAIGAWVTTGDGSHISEAETKPEKLGTAALQAGPTKMVWLPGQEMEGAIPSAELRMADAELLVLTGEQANATMR